VEGVSVPVVEVRTRPLAVGQPIGEANVVAHTGQLLSLSDFRGRPLVVTFCPSVRNSACADQLKQLRSSWLTLRTSDAAVLGVTRDDGTWLRDYVAESELPFLLIGDPNGKLADVWGVPRDGAVTFVADAEGRVRGVINGLNAPTLASDVLGALKPG
jgi:peroxiredoxin Q/BCP